MAISPTVKGQSATIYLDTVHVLPGHSAYVRVLCSTEINIAGARIPLKISEAAPVIVDSVIFASMVKVYGMVSYTFLGDTLRKAFINVLPDIGHPTIPQASFPPPGGEICRIYFSVPASVLPQFVLVDTFYYAIPIGNHNEYDSLNLSDDNGAAIFPSFRSGGLWIDQITDVSEDAGSLPNRFALEQNYPNPFNPSTLISFELPRPGDVRLDVYDLLGQRVSTLAAGRYPSGRDNHNLGCFASPFRGLLLPT